MKEVDSGERLRLYNKLGGHYAVAWKYKPTPLRLVPQAV